MTTIQNIGLVTTCDPRERRLLMVIDVTVISSLLLSWIVEFDYVVPLGNSLMLYCCSVLTTRLTKLTHMWL